MDLESEFLRFKMDLLRKMPFYGDIVMRLPFVRNDSIATARTDGGRIEYNPAFLSGLKREERNFVLMHEVFHVLLFHCSRIGDRNPALWNTAADIIVNNMLIQLKDHMKKAGIPFDKPSKGIFVPVGPNDTVDNVYEKLLSENRSADSRTKTVKISTNARYDRRPSVFDVPDDIVLPLETADGGCEESGAPEEKPEESPGQARLSETMILQIIRGAAASNRSSMGSCFVPKQIFGLTESKRIPWHTLLRDHFTEIRSDDASYDTPERKYLHMDMILPGVCPEVEKLEEVWAFVDSSGSVGRNEMEQFLTQLYRIAKEFRCVFNVCYWNTAVTDVYRKLTKEDEILKSVPRHSGGTDINCVYGWLKENHIRPDVMLILTDGYFGLLDNRVFNAAFRKKTILVLSGTIAVNDSMKQMGKITRLEN